MQDKLIASLVAVPTLYFAFYLTWLGTFATTCTMGDPKSLDAGLVLSLLPYLIGIIFLCCGHLNVVGLLLSLPLFPLMSWQMSWGFELLVTVNLNGRNACYLMMGDEFSRPNGGWLEQVYAPYYVLVSIGSMYALIYSYRNWRRPGGGRDQKCSALTDTFERKRIPGDSE